MHSKRTIQCSVTALLLSGLLILVAACTDDPLYDINNISVDPSITVFDDGITLPVGTTAKISLDSLMKLAGQDFDVYFKEAENGELAVNIRDTATLDDRIKKMDIASMASIDGVSFTEDFQYHVGSFNADDFSIDGKTYELKVPFDGIDVVDVKSKPISALAEGLTFHAGLDKYKDVVTGNEDLDLGKKIGDLDYDYLVVERSEIDAHAAGVPTEVVAIPKTVVDDMDFPEQTATLHMDNIVLDEKITGIHNIKTNPDAKVTVCMSLENVCFTGGQVTPDINLNFDGKLKIAGGNVVNIKDIVLNAENGWSGSKSYSILGLEKTDYYYSISLDEQIPVSGHIIIADPVTTKTKLAQTSGDIRLRIELKFSDFVIESADLDISSDTIDLSDKVSFGEFNDTQLPEQIEDVIYVELDETQPLKLKVVPKNLDKLKPEKLNYTFTMHFPESFVVEGAVNGQLSYAGDLVGGPAEIPVPIKEIRPTVKDRKLSVDSEVTVTATVLPKNMSLNSAEIPQNKEQDLSFTVTLEGTPVIKDYRIKLKDYDEDADLSEPLEIEVKGLGDFSGARVIPEGTPVIVVNLDVPSINGLSFSPGKNGLTIGIPNFLILDADGIDQSLNFNAEANTITLRNEFPAQISLPIKELVVKPETVGGKKKIISAYTATGGVTIPGTELSQSDLKASFGSDVGLSIVFPSIKAASIVLDESFSFDVNQKFDLTISNLPEELKSVDEVILDEVYLNLEAVFDGLPSKSPFNVDLTITLPSFITPNSIPIKGSVENRKLKITPVKLEKLSGLVVPPEGVIKDELSLAGTISASGTDIDLTELKPDVTATLTASLQNSEGKLAISKASGHFSYNLSESTTIKLDELPDMLKDGSVCLDLLNPSLALDIISNIGIPLTTTMELVPYRNDKPMGNSIKLENVVMPYTPSSAEKAKRRYYICNTDEGLPAGYEYLKADITSLIKEIPDSVVVNIDAAISDAVTAVVEPKAEYHFDIAFEINVPLSFGEDFKLASEIEIPLDGVDAITSIGTFGFKGLFLNETPLKIAKLSIDLLDSESVLIPLKEGYDNSAPLKPRPDLDPAGSLSDFEFYLAPADLSRKIAKGRIKFEIGARPNQILKKTDCIQLRNMVVVAPEGITISSNELSINK